MVIVGLLVGDSVPEGVGVFVKAGDGVGDAELVTVKVGVPVLEYVGVKVMVHVGVNVSVKVGVPVLEYVGVKVPEHVGVNVGVEQNTLNFAYMASRSGSFPGPI
jgi:hypothetical protein